MPARVHDTRVIAREERAPGVMMVTIQAPALSAAVFPGQFVMAELPSGCAAAVALAIYDAYDDIVSLLFFITGPRTRELAALAAGDSLALLGPLGNGFDLRDAPADVAIAAGGVGIASVLLPARELVRRRSRVRLFYGARSAALLVERERFVQAGCEVTLATEDGSEGLRGYVTDALEASAPAKLLLACGPTPMLRAVAQIATRTRVPAQLCLEETFGCGVGGCWGCVVPVAATSPRAPRFPSNEAGISYARICREGPVFMAEELRW